VAKESRSRFEKILGSRQLTDAYLLMLARRHNATFVTFDTRLKNLAGAETKVRVLGA
jgi:predicted nucleic acid-binding protein